MEIKGEKSMICHSCNRQVNGKKKFNWLIFLLTCFTGFGWALYLIYYFTKSPKCELCGSKL